MTLHNVSQIASEVESCFADAGSVSKTNAGRRLRPLDSSGKQPQFFLAFPNAVRNLIPILTFLLLFSFQQSHGQQHIYDVMDSTLNIKRDVRLDSLVMRHIRVNEMRDGLKGYRLQLFSGSGTTARQEANQLRADFMARHPETPAYLIYQAPNFKVRVGDFRTELEAIKLQRELEYQWPGAFVVRDDIKFPKLAIDQEQDQEEELEEEETPVDGEDSGE